MTKGNRDTVLQKKIEELESDLQKFSQDINRRFDHQKINRRFDFLRKLLSREMEIHPENPQFLDQVQLRLAFLEKAWNDFQPSLAEHPETLYHPCSCKEDCFDDGSLPGTTSQVEDNDNEDPENSTWEFQDLPPNSTPEPTDAILKERRSARRVWATSNVAVVILLVLAMMVGLMTASFSKGGHGKQGNFLKAT